MNGATHVNDSSTMVPDQTSETRASGPVSITPYRTRKFCGFVKERCVLSVLGTQRYVNANPNCPSSDADPLNVQLFSRVSSTSWTNEAHRVNSPPSHQWTHSLFDGLFYSPPVYMPPQLARFNDAAFHHAFDSLVHAVQNGNVKYLRAALSSRHLDLALPLMTPVLINHQGSAGLGLLHHAVSPQQGCPSIGVLDELFRAGSDVGLFSTFGLTPLHRLAWMAHEDAKPAQGHEASQTTQRSSLRAFTTHLVHDLHAPLHATDKNGETPMHVAAEHGHSSSVLQAMLESDNMLVGRTSAREVKNKRG